jgi:esterase/lipase superfamily enzyme
VGVTRHAELYSPAIGAAGNVVAYGHWGRPVLAFPAEGGGAWDLEGQGMVAAVGGLLEAGRAKLYCVDAFDAESWSKGWVPYEERRHGAERYASWVVDEVVPWIFEDCGGPQEIVTTGCSMGATHALTFALGRADLFPLAICLSGNYEVAGAAHHISQLYGDHLDWLRGRLSVVLVCGQGMWEDTTGSLESTRRMAGLLAEKGIRHELDLWGHDVPHDWPSWRAQIAHHLPRFC